MNKKKKGKKLPELTVSQLKWLVNSFDENPEGKTVEQLKEIVEYGISYDWCECGRKNDTFLPYGENSEVAVCCDMCAEGLESFDLESDTDFREMVLRDAFLLREDHTINLPYDPSDPEMDNQETQEFSTSSCDNCWSPIAGKRYIFLANLEKVFFCPDCTERYWEKEYPEVFDC